MPEEGAASMALRRPPMREPVSSWILHRWDARVDAKVSQGSHSMRMEQSKRSLTRRELIVGATAAVFGSSRAAHAESSALDVTAKLLEIPSKLPPDDLYDYAYVMRYQVVGGPLDKQFLLVAHYKPRQPRSKIKDKMKSQVGGKLRSFTEGDMHKLRLSPDLKEIWKGALVDEYSSTDRTSTRYWCLQADPA
jgi:hypothetical protein